MTEYCKLCQQQAVVELRDLKCRVKVSTSTFINVQEGYFE